jgi:DNA-directed RNA polymerase specialized sigma24 family protein
MAQDRISRLSEGQRECLRMVYRHMETKEIARTLGISPDGVAQRIKTAMRILGRPPPPRRRPHPRRSRRRRARRRHALPAAG